MFQPPERVGFVGLGNMGAPMARNLARAGYRLAVADSNPSAVERFSRETPCESPPSLVELARACRLVITMLPDGNAVRQVVLGESGLACGLAPGAVVVDMTSASPVGTRELARVLASSSITLLDAPVSGGVTRAVEGKLAIMAGGDAETIERCRPLLSALGKVFVTGGSGSGHAVKALNNYLSAVALVATAEAMAASERFGIDPRTVLDVLNSSTGRNTATEHKYPTFVLPRTFNSGFALGLMAKDLRIALELARSVGTPADLLAECAQTYARAEQQLGFGADNTEVVRYLESLIRPASAASPGDPP